jgi:hypothetical protein
VAATYDCDPPSLGVTFTSLLLCFQPLAWTKLHAEGITLSPPAPPCDERPQGDIDSPAAIQAGAGAGSTLVSSGELRAH